MNRHYGTGLLLGVLVFLVVGIVVALRFWQIGRAIGPTCSIGVAGTSVSVTAKGWNAPLACEVVRNQLAGATHGLSAAILVPRPAEATTTAVVCRAIVAHDRVTVHDGGPLGLAGKALCGALPHAPPT